MIKLSSNSGSSKQRLKQAVNHTGNHNGTVYLINHNFGTRDVNVSVRYESTNSGWVDIIQYAYIGSQNYGFQSLFNTTTQVQVNLFLWLQGNPTASLDAEIIVEEA